MFLEQGNLSDASICSFNADTMLSEIGVDIAEREGRRIKGRATL